MPKKPTDEGTKPLQTPNNTQAPRISVNLLKEVAKADVLEESDISVYVVLSRATYDEIVKWSKILA